MSQMSQGDGWWLASDGRWYPPSEDSELHDFEDDNGPVPAHRHPNGGGWVANTAHVDKTAFVGPYAAVFGNATVTGNARITDTDWVLGDARVSGNARVSGDAEVNGNAHVQGSAQVGGSAFVAESAVVEDSAVVGGQARILGAALLHGMARVEGIAEISGDVVISEDLQLTQHPLAHGTAAHSPPPPSVGAAYGVPTAAPTTSTNGFAVASLVLGILYLGGIGSLLAVLFGHHARKQIREDDGRLTGKGMATAGVILGWLGIAGIAVIVAVLVIVKAAGNSNPS